MGRRKSGWYWAYIVRPTDLKETEFVSGDVTIKFNERDLAFWGGCLLGKDRWYSWRDCGTKFFLNADAETEALLLVGRCPDLLGKVRVETFFVPDPKPERKKRTWRKAASGG